VGIGVIGYVTNGVRGGEEYEELGQKDGNDRGGRKPRRTNWRGTFGSAREFIE